MSYIRTGVRLIVLLLTNVKIYFKTPQSQLILRFKRLKEIFKPTSTPFFRLLLIYDLHKPTKVNRMIIRLNYTYSLLYGWKK